ncbi:hypothetical protein GOBAR_AA09404 [Gossypium barbadense]|uniref:Mur ligase central domain-containing protein n=1 Tax=Gossypium barbadense TaxID=3634 RepID=A0A2P5Y6P8_GOSBA|nr:hypothetical protein GOBAR_AA09404 [Gossypium barbadense]
MAFSLLSLPKFLPPHPSYTSLKGHRHHRHRGVHFKPLRLPSLRRLPAIGPDGKYYPTPSDEDPPEAPEDSMHGVDKFQQIHRQAARARKLQEEDFNKHKSNYLSAIADVDEDELSKEKTGNDDGDDLFGEIDKAIAMKRQEMVKQGLLEQAPKKAEAIDELDPDEVVDLEEIDKLRGLTVASDSDEGENEDSDDEDSSKFDVCLSDSEGKERGNDKFNLLDPSFDLDLDSFGKSKVRIVEPKFKMSLAELLDESKVVPVSVYGDIEVEITGIQHDSRLVSAGDLFVCCVGRKTDGHLYLSEADKRGAVAVVASKEIDIEDTLGCKALVIVEDTNSVLPALAASFYRHPSRNMAVIGITETNGKTTTSYLIKGMYEAMGLRTGMLSTVAYYIHGDNKLESPNTTPDAVLVQNLMAKMLHNGTEAVVMEASSHGLALGRCNEIGCPGESDRGKRPMMAKIATDKSEVTMLTSDNPKSEDPLDILDDMLAGVGWTMQDYLKYGENDYYPPLPNGHRLFLHDIRRVAVRCAVAMGEEGDMVVIAGKGHETYQIEGDKKEFFDDREECREALQYVDELHQAGIDTSEFPWR